MECQNQKERKTTSKRSYRLCSDYWTRKGTGGEGGTGTRGLLDKIPFRTATVGDSQAAESIRSYLLVDYVKRGANGSSGDASSESGKGQCEGTKL